MPAKKNSSSIVRGDVSLSSTSSEQVPIITTIAPPPFASSLSTLLNESTSHSSSSSSTSSSSSSSSSSSLPVLGTEGIGDGSVAGVAEEVDYDDEAVLNASGSTYGGRWSRDEDLALRRGVEILGVRLLTIFVSPLLLFFIPNTSYFYKFLLSSFSLGKELASNFRISRR
jgi:hypothetical protein